MLNESQISGELCGKSKGLFSAKSYSDAFCILKVCSCEHLSARLECPCFHPATWSVIHPLSALAWGRCRLQTCLCHLAYPEVWNTWKIMGTKTSFYYQNIQPGNTPVLHVLWYYNLSMAMVWCYMADTGALGTLCPMGRWDHPTLWAIAEWNRAGMVAVSCSTHEATHRYGCLVAEHTCSKLCMAVSSLPCTYTFQCSKFDHGKTALVGWVAAFYPCIGREHYFSHFLLHWTPSHGGVWQLLPDEEGCQNGCSSLQLKKTLCYFSDSGYGPTDPFEQDLLLPFLCLRASE